MTGRVVGITCTDGALAVRTFIYTGADTR